MYFLAAADVPDAEANANVGGGTALNGSRGGVGVLLGVDESCGKCGSNASEDDADVTLPSDELGVEVEGPV